MILGLKKWSAGMLTVLLLLGASTESVQAEKLRTVAEWQKQVEKLQGKKQLDAYAEAIRQYPAYADFYIKRGKAYLRRGESQMAKLDFDKAILLDDKSAAAYTGRAEERACAGDSRAAWEAYEKALSLDDKDPLILQSRAYFYYEGLADYQKAFSDYDRAAKLVEREEDPRLLKIAMQKLGAQLKYAAVQKGYYATIVNSVDNILAMKKQKINPKQLEYLYSSRCLAHSELEQYPEALRDSQQVLRFMGRDKKRQAIVLRQQSRILDKMDLPQAARETMKAALLRNPGLMADRPYELDKDLSKREKMQEAW